MTATTGVCFLSGDEATAFADPQSESRIQAALAQLVKGRTLLVIAHQLSTVVGADQIIVLDEHGRIVETGPHHDLITRPDGRYAAFWNQRSHALGWRLLPTAPDDLSEPPEIGAKHTR